MYWLYFAEDKLPWRAAVPSVLKLRFECNAVNFFSSWMSVCQDKLCCLDLVVLCWVVLCWVLLRCYVAVLVGWVLFHWLAGFGLLWLVITTPCSTEIVMFWRACCTRTRQLSQWQVCVCVRACLTRFVTEVIKWLVRCRHFDWTQKNKRLIRVIWNEKSGLFTADWVAFRTSLLTVANTLQNKWHSN